MRHYDPDDPIWTEDEDRRCALTESLEEWQAEVDAEWAGHDLARAVLVGIVSDEGSLVVFRTADDRRVAIAHGLAQAVVDALEADGEVEVAVDEWALL